MSLTRRNRNRKRHDVRRVVLATVGGMIGAATLVGAHSFTLVRDSLRDVECDAAKLGENTRVYDVHGKLLATIAADQNRLAVPLGKVSPFLVDATIATEDKKFYRHTGIDYDRIIGAAVNDVSGGGRQGGSTLTMQLMRNLCHPTVLDRTVGLKLEEAYLAKAYEKTHTKENIMQRYLNSVFYGNNSIGVFAASHTYFDREPADLTLRQAALLAGLPQAPTTYNPFVNPDAAKVRRNLVLDEMAQDGFITQAQADRIKPSGLQLKRGTYFRDKVEPFYVDYVTELLKASIGADKVENGGYRVYTAIDPKLQDAARVAMRNFLRQNFGTGGPSAALVMIDARTGVVKAMASSEEYSKKRQFNIAGPTALRSAGSTFKTFVLTAALAQGVSPSTTYFSKSPVQIDGTKCASPTGPAKVETFGRKGGGSMSLVRATTASDNSVYAQLTCDLGPEAVFQMARKMGITSLRASGGLEDRYNISLGLGGLTDGVSVLEMARAYAPLVNGGYRVDIRPMTKLVRRDGKVSTFKAGQTKIFSDGVAAEVAKILRQNVLGGTGTAANLANVPVAGKTGTTNDLKDAWFVGFTPRYVTAVWVGYPDVQRQTGLQGGRVARIWHDFMAIATAGESNQAFAEPSTPFVAQSFNGYYKRQAAALAAEEKKKKEEEEKKKKEEEEKKKREEEEKNNPTPPAGEPGGAPGGSPPPGTPPTGGTPPPPTP